MYTVESLTTMEAPLLASETASAAMLVVNMLFLGCTLAVFYYLRVLKKREQRIVAVSVESRYAA